MHHSRPSPSRVMFTVRGIIGTEARAFPEWVTHNYTKSHGRLANARKSGRLENLVRENQGADAQKICYHVRGGVAAAEKDEHLFLLRRERPAVVEVVLGLRVTGTAVKTPTTSTANDGYARLIRGFAFSPNALTRLWSSIPSRRGQAQLPRASSSALP